MRTRGSKRRPTRSALEQLIREAGGSMTRLAGRVGVTRQTLYTWVYQLDLAGVVGIRTREQQQEDTMREGTSEAQHVEGPGRPPSGRVSVTSRMDPALWRACRIRAIEEDRSTAEILEDAVRAYLAT